MTRLIGALAAVLLALAACSSSTPSGGGGGAATADPTIAFCAALDTYGAALVDFEALTPSATVDEYKAAGTAAKAALAALVAVAGPFAGAQINELTTAQSELNTVVDQLPPNATPAMAELAIDPAVKDVIQQVVAQRNATCNTRPTPSSASAY
jgi:outer membrane murein-binding lipoprotein Lpp